jgi:spectinomycin phosphotransferase
LSRSTAKPPDLGDDAIAGALHAGFGVRAAALAPLPVGNDADSWSYRVEAARGPAYFLKVRAGANRTRGAWLPAHLRRHGVPNVLAPLATGDGAPCVLLDRFALALYPMLDAVAGAEAGLSPVQWRRLGAVVRQVHATPPTPELTRVAGREAFRPSRRELLGDLEARMAAPADPVAAEVAGLWRARQAVIGALVERADGLGGDLARRSFPAVLCHADLHTHNVLVDADGQLWIVDWDEGVLAPRERDLMFMVGGGIGQGLVRPGEDDRFFEGYGQTAAEERLLAYYRCAWAVQDILANAEQVLVPAGLSEAARRAAVAGFLDLFAPGNIVDLARGQAA